MSNVLIKKERNFSQNKWIFPDKFGHTLGTVAILKLTNAVYRGFVK